LRILQIVITKQLNIAMAKNPNVAPSNKGVNVNNKSISNQQNTTKIGIASSGIVPIMTTHPFSNTDAIKDLIAPNYYGGPGADKVSKKNGLS